MAQVRQVVLLFRLPYSTGGYTETLESKTFMPYIWRRKNGSESKRLKESMVCADCQHSGVHRLFYGLDDVRSYRHSD